MPRPERTPRLDGSVANASLTLGADRLRHRRPLQLQLQQRTKERVVLRRGPHSRDCTVRSDGHSFGWKTQH